MKILHITNGTRCSHIISQGLAQRNIDFDTNKDYVSFGKILKKSNIDVLQAYDYIICGNTDIADQIEKNNLWHKTIFYEFRDSCVINKTMLKGLAYFKRSVTCGSQRIPIDNKKIYPLNHCALEEYFLEETDRIYTVGCFFDKSNHRLGERRLNLINFMIENNKFQNSMIGISTGYASPARLALFEPLTNNICMKYLTMLSETQIVFTAQPGPTDGDHRTWEAFASGTLVFKDLSYIPTPNMPIDRIHSFTFDATDNNSIKSALKTAEYYLDHQEERNQIASQGQEHIKKYHMAGNRIDQIFETIDSISNKKRVFLL